MFDPKNVDRREGVTWDLSEHGGRECVLATDYDQLLELYKQKESELVRIGVLWGLGPHAAKYPEAFYGRGLGDLIRESGGMEITRIMSKEEAEVWKSQIDKESRPENGQIK